MSEIKHKNLIYATSLGLIPMGYESQAVKIYLSIKNKSG